ncbi:hypothetical protein Tco_1417723 [Tanacetum coccineum]
MGSLQMDDDDEISNLVDLHMYVLCGNTCLGGCDGKISMLDLVDHFGKFGGGFEQDIDDEGEEDKEYEEGDGEV